MSDENGLLLAIESADTVFAQEQITFLKDRLERAGVAVRVYLFPTKKHSSGLFVRNYEEDVYGSSKSVSPYAASLFYTLNLFQFAKEIRQATAEGYTVLVNGYSASYMANESLKLKYPEERRGYFVWCDSIEHQVLRLPRSAKTYILRRQMNEKSKDISALLAAQRELTELFPQDFHEVDTSREGRNMEAKAVSEIVWGAVKPLIPLRQSEDNSPELASNTTRQLSSSTITIPEVSYSLLPYFASDLVSSEKFNIQTNSYYVPKALTSTSSNRYQKQMDTLLQLRADISKKLREHTKSHDGAIADQVSYIEGALLPLAATTEITVGAKKEPLEDLIVQLMLAGKPEAETIANKILKTVRKQDGSFWQEKDLLQQKVSSMNADRQNRNSLRRQANDALSNSYGEPGDDVRLLSYEPRNEFANIANLLYSESNLSLQEIQAQVDAWPYDKKEKTLLELSDTLLYSAMDNGQPPIYSFDILSDQNVFMALQPYALNGSVVWQDATPRYGYKHQPLAEELGLSELIDDIYDTSFELYGTLQQQAGEQAAHYAVLRGHMFRWRAAFNLSGLAQMRKQLLNVYGVNSYVKSMLTAVKEVHPLLGPIDKQSEQAYNNIS